MARRSGRLFVGEHLRHLNPIGPAVALADEVTNAVHDRLTKVRLQRAVVPGIEILQVPQR
jgi:hypothetical protein